MLQRKLLSFFRRRQIAADLEEEMEFHRELRARSLQAEGLGARDAGRAANRRFGNSTSIKEESLAMWRWNAIEDFASDVRYALRWMKASPLFTGVVVVTLALGIGANTAIFSLANALLLRTLPVHDAQQLYYVHILPEQPDGANNTGNSETSFSYAVYRAMRTQSRAFKNLIAYVPLGYNKIPIRTGTIPEEASVDMVSGDFFSALGVQLTCGSGFQTSNEEAGSSVAVISQGLWNRKFGGTCSALGKTVFIKGLPFTVAGIAPENFRGVEAESATDVWIPFQRRPELNAWGADRASYRADPKWWCIRLIARLPRSLNPGQASEMVHTAFMQSAYEPLGGKPRRGEPARRLDLIPARGLGQPGLNKPLAILMGMVALVLLIACTNVAMMLVARNASRQREFGIRLALGGGQLRLFRQLLAESLLLVLAGTSIGYTLAWRATGLLANWAELDASLAPDANVLLFTLVISLAMCLLFGLLPLFGTARNSSSSLLAQGSQSTAFTGRAQSRSRQAVLVLQMALGFVLIVSAGLFTHSLRKLEGRKLGFVADRILVFGINPPSDAGSGARNASFYQGLVEQVRQIPGVARVSYVENRPGSSWSNNTDVKVDGRSDIKSVRTGSNMMRWNGVGPEYFATLGIPLRQGRDFTQADSAKAEKTAIINETFARDFLNGRSALGHTVSFTSQYGFTVVGVVADHNYTSLREDSVPMAYFPVAQLDLGAMHVLVRTALEPTALLPAIRRKIAAYDPDLALLQPRTEAAEFASTADTERLIARLAVFFGGMAMLLVATGLYGTLAYRVNRRTAELGIRMAVGAQRRQILWLVLRESLVTLIAGVCLGLPLAVAAGHWLASLLYELTPYDSVAIAIATLGITAVTIVASLIPAQRAASIDPIRALRHE